MRFRLVASAAVLYGILALVGLRHHFGAIVAVLVGILALVGLRHPRVGRIYGTHWPPYLTDARRRRIAYVMYGAAAIALMGFGLANLLQATRQDAFIIASLIVLACAFGAGVVGLIAAIRFRQARP